MEGGQVVGFMWVYLNLGHEIFIRVTTGTSLIKLLAVFLMVGFIDWTARYNLRLSYQKEL